MKEQGFTVVELLVVLVVIVVLFSVVVSNFPSARLQLNVSRAAYQFQQDVRRVEDLSLSEIPYQTASGPVEVDGYGIYVDLASLGNKKYIIYADKSPGNHQYDASDYIVDTIDLSSSAQGVVLREINNISGQSTSLNVARQASNIDISFLGGNNKSVEFVFTPENDPALRKSVWVNTSGLAEIK